MQKKIWFASPSNLLLVSSQTNSCLQFRQVGHFVLKVRAGDAQSCKKTSIFLPVSRNFNYILVLTSCCSDGSFLSCCSGEFLLKRHTSHCSSNDSASVIKPEIQQDSGKVRLPCSRSVQYVNLLHIFLQIQNSVFELFESQKREKDK